MPISRVVRTESTLRSDLIFRFEELAGLAESEFGIDSGAMYNDLHAPSVPVQPLDGGHAAASTTKVRLPSFAADRMLLSRMV